MSLFFEVLNSINDPKQSGSIDQLASVMNVVSDLSKAHDLDAGSVQSVMSAMSDPMRSVMQSKMGSGNPMDFLGSILGGNAGAVNSLFTPQLQQQMVQMVSQKTGISSSIIQTVLPALIPVVLNLFKMGSGSQGNLSSNSLFNSFLNGDRADLGQVLQYSSRFLMPAFS